MRAATCEGMYTVAFATEGDTTNVGSDTPYTAMWRRSAGLIIPVSLLMPSLHLTHGFRKWFARSARVPHAVAYGLHGFDDGSAFIRTAASASSAVGHSFVPRSRSRMSVACASGIPRRYGRSDVSAS